MSDYTVESFPGTAAIDFRVHVPPPEIPVLTQHVERLARDLDWELEYPAGDGLPYEHTLV